MKGLPPAPPKDATREEKDARFRERAEWRAARDLETHRKIKRLVWMIRHRLSFYEKEGLVRILDEHCPEIFDED